MSESDTVCAPANKQECEQGVNNAKSELINDILKMRVERGLKPSVLYFERLYDFSIEELHAQIIKEQDKTYFNNR